MIFILEAQVQSYEFFDSVKSACMYTVCALSVNTLCFKSGHNSRLGATKIELHQSLAMDEGKSYST